jgi:hypothetical protein
MLCGQPFRRIKSEEIAVPEALADNSYEAKQGAAGGWGEKASRDLIVTKGKSFRHEKVFFSPLISLQKKHAFIIIIIIIMIFPSRPAFID